MTDDSAMPLEVDRAQWRTTRTALLAREKAHTREGDAISAARRRLPMTEVDARATLVGPHGSVSLLDVFDGRRQLIAYKHMWHSGEGVADQCEGCTATIYDIHDASYLHHRGVTFAVFCAGPWAEVEPFVQFMGYRLPWYSMTEVEDPAVGAGLVDEPGNFACYLRVGDRVFLTNEAVGRGVEVTMLQAQLLDLTVYGRQEEWEDSPAGWPRHPTATWWKREGRPVPVWGRPGLEQVVTDDAERRGHCCG